VRWGAPNTGEPAAGNRPVEARTALCNIT
jgi:hypothetical protein